MALVSPGDVSPGRHEPDDNRVDQVRGEEPACSCRCLDLPCEEILTAVIRNRVGVEFDAETGAGGDGEHAVLIEVPTAGGDLVDVDGAGEVFDEVGVGESGGEVEIG